MITKKDLLISKGYNSSVYFYDWSFAMKNMINIICQEKLLRSQQELLTYSFDFDNKLNNEFVKLLLNFFVENKLITFTQICDFKKGDKIEIHLTDDQLEQLNNIIMYCKLMK